MCEGSFSSRSAACAADSAAAREFADPSRVPAGPNALQRKPPSSSSSTENPEAVPMSSELPDTRATVAQLNRWEGAMPAAWRRMPDGPSRCRVSTRPARVPVATNAAAWLVTTP
jgi:hypothetical protein